MNSMTLDNFYNLAAAQNNKRSADQLNHFESRKKHQKLNLDQIPQAEVDEPQFSSFSDLQSPSPSSTNRAFIYPQVTRGRIIFKFN